MRVLTLTQPWATAVALGSKRIETRSWKTSYRGPVAIQAAKGYNRGELLHLGSCWNWVGALWAAGARMGEGKPLEQLLPFGAIVAVAQLNDCRPTGSYTQSELDTLRRPAHATDEEPGLYHWTERQMGDYSLGRFAFELGSIFALPEPVPVRGALGLWTLGLDDEQLVNRQLMEVGA